MLQSVFPRQGGTVRARNPTQLCSPQYRSNVNLSMRPHLANSSILFLRTAPVQFGTRGVIKMKGKPGPQLKKTSSYPCKAFPVNI